MKTSISIPTNQGLVRFYFNSEKESVKFSYDHASENFKVPAYIIYKEILFAPKDFEDPNFAFIKYGCRDITCLSEVDYKAFCKYLLDQNTLYRQEFITSQIKISQMADHAVDAWAYYLRSISPINEAAAEKEIIDLLDIPALENSLNEALSRENYTAAAHIKKKALASGHFIIEMNGELKIRKKQQPEQLNGKDYKHIFYPGH